MCVCLSELQVLADDTNQDKMRSLLLVFRHMRAFAGEYDARLIVDVTPVYFLGRGGV